MASLPFIALRVSSHALRLSCVVLGAGLFIWSLYNALEMGGQAQATAKNPKLAIVTKAEDYRAQISRLETQKAAIPKHEVITSDDRVDKECKTGRGPNCQRMGADRDLTKRVEKVDDEIRVERQKITDLGPIPTEIDHAAAMMGDLGNVEEKRVSKWLGFVYAFIVEGLAFIGPASVFSALSPREKVESKPPLPRGEKRPLQATKKKVEGKIETPVGAWKRERTEKVEGESIKASDAYKDYCHWCRVIRKITPLSDKAFYVAMKDDPSVKNARKKGCSHYADLAFKKQSAQPALHVVSA